MSAPGPSRVWAQRGPGGDVLLSAQRHTEAGKSVHRTLASRGTPHGYTPLAPVYLPIDVVDHRRAPCCQGLIHCRSGAPARGDLVLAGRTQQCTECVPGPPGTPVRAHGAPPGARRAGSQGARLIGLWAARRCPARWWRPSACNLGGRTEVLRGDTPAANTPRGRLLARGDVPWKHPRPVGLTSRGRPCPPRGP